MRSYISAICVVVCMASLGARPTSAVVGTPGSDLFFFDEFASLEQVTTTLVNPYSGFTIDVNRELFISDTVYDGLGGDDTMLGSAFDDYFRIDNPSIQLLINIETFLGGDGSDIIKLASPTHVLGDTRILAGKGNDIVWANQGNDEVRGFNGDDILDGGPGNDMILGENNNDTIQFALGYDTDDIDGGAHFDEIRFAAGIGLNDLTLTPTGADPFLREFEILVGNDGDKINAINVERLRFDDGSLFNLVVPGGEGDFDGDAFVGISDLNIVLGNWNAVVTPGDLLVGDSSGDGFVGIADLNVVLGNWNNGSPPAAENTVPEPASLGLLLIGSMGLLQKR